jgi:prepilin signal peptidase PulO-like enzyme (type II secretory pathway)
MTLLAASALAFAPFAGVLVWAFAVRHLTLEPEAEGARLRAPLDALPVIAWVRDLRAPGPLGRAAAGRAAVEIGAVAVAVWAWQVEPAAMVWPTCALGWLLLAASLVDARERILPDEINAAVAVLGLAVAAPLSGVELLGRVIGAVAGFAILAGFAALYERVRGREGLGRGDAKLLGALGAWVGWQGLSSVVLIGAGAGVGAVLLSGLLSRRLPRGESSLALGPYLALGGWLTWLYGPVGFMRL